MSCCGKPKCAETIPREDLVKVFAENRKGVIARLEKEPTFVKDSLIVMKGGCSACRNDTDDEPLFRQESYFYYMFGVRDPDCYGVVHPNGKTVLFIPKLDVAWEMWIGPLLPPSHYLSFYGVDECYFVEEMESYLQKVDPKVIYVRQGRNSDSGEVSPAVTFPGHEDYRVDNGLLHDVMSLARVHKNPEELKVLRYACRTCSLGHMAAMNAVQPGIMEFQLESTFRYATSINGETRYPAFTSILGSGRNSSICHYGHASLPNDKMIHDGDLIVSDQGCLCYGYSSDVTTTFPANGTFSPLQKNLYSAVLAMNLAVQNAMKKGVSWSEMHRLSYQVGLEHMIQWGLLKGDIKEMMAVNLCSAFMPHGLGHFMGVDTHDVGGYLKGFPARPTLDGFRKLRTNAVLEPGMVITVEPGLYFIDSCLKPALEDPSKSKFIVKAVLDEYYKIGGCRLEDDVLVTETGVECLTCLPRTVEDVEAFCQRKKTKLSEITPNKFYKGKLD